MKNTLFCPKCKKKLFVYQTYRKEIITLQGTSNVRVEIRYCPNHKKPIIIKPCILTQLVAKGRIYGIDILIAIGLLRWGLCLQREQIQIYFKRKNIKISTGTISNLSFDFLLLLKQIHEKQYDKLKEKFSKRRGMIIHVDATDENGGNAVFQIKEENTGITLLAESLVSEKEEYINTIFQKFKAIFGKPIAIVRDMGSAIINSCNKEFPNIPQQICHYHFIRGLGTKIFDDIYTEFRLTISKSKIISDLRYIRKYIKQKLKKSSIILNERHALYWGHLLIDYIYYPIKHVKDYPFQLAYKEFYERIIEIYDSFLTKNLQNCGTCIKIQPLSSLTRDIQDFIRNKKIQKLFNTIVQLWEWYIEIRETMGLMRIELNKSKILTQEKIETMKEDLTQLIDKIQDKGNELDGQYLQKSKLIANYFQDKWDGLFIDLKDQKGNYIPIHRDNNIDEQAHRWVRMRIRRRTGKNRTRLEMYQTGALLALFSNLYNKEYRDIICNGIDNLAKEFSALDWNQLPIERRKLFLRNDGVAIPVKDETRRKLLFDFVENIMEDSLTKNNFLGKWLIKMNKYIDRWNIDFVDDDINLDLL